MSMGEIIGSLNNDQVTRIIDRLGKASLTTTSHLFHKYGNRNIIDSVNDHVKSFSTKAQARPALGLIEVVLSANGDYNRHVLPNINRIEQASDVSGFDQLQYLLRTSSPEEFYTFWGPRDPMKYRVLEAILLVVPTLREIYPQSTDDYELMNTWARNVDLKNYRNDPIGKINNVAVATVQHLRMTFGHDTVKPDRRVKQVLELEFGLQQLNDVNSILAVERIAQAAKLSALTIDQIFVNYGSGYYGKDDLKKEPASVDFVIWPQHEVFYIESMLTITNTAMADQSMLQTIVEDVENGKVEHISLIIDLSQNLIHHTAALSRYFWPSQSKGHKKRGQKLRKAFQVGEDSVLRDREIRNLIEHFDENLDTYVSNGIAGTILPKYIGIRGDLDLAVTHIFRAFFFDDWKFHVLGKEIELVPIIQELIRIHLMLEESQRSGGRLPKHED